MPNETTNVGDFEMITAFRFNNSVYYSLEDMDEARKEYYKNGAEKNIKGILSQLNNMFEVGGGLPGQFEYLMRVIPDLVQLKEIYDNPLPEPAAKLLSSAPPPDETKPEETFTDPRGGKTWFGKSRDI